jgi:hypothetical protein
MQYPDATCLIDTVAVHVVVRPGVPVGRYPRGVALGVALSGRGIALALEVRSVRLIGVVPVSLTTVRQAKSEVGEKGGAEQALGPEGGRHAGRDQLEPSSGPAPTRIGFAP